MDDDQDPSPSPASAELILVQIDENAAILFGASRPDWLDVEPLVGASERDRARMRDALTLAVAGNVGAQALPSLMAAQGIVQLSPQTLAALETLSPMVGANGWNLGTLVNGTSNFGHSVQWAPTAAASAATFAASLGMSVALLAIQLQLRQISQKIDRNLALSRDILDELRWKNDAELIGLDAAIRQAAAEVGAIGAATPEIYGEIRGKEHLLEQARELLLRRSSAHLEKLSGAGSAEDRRAWVDDHAERCVTDLRSLVRVHQDWFAFQAIRAAHAAEVDVSERGADLVDRIRTQAQSDNEVVAERVVDLADQLQRQLGLLEEASGRQIGRFAKGKGARTRAATLRKEIAEIVPIVAQDASQLAPTMAIGNKEDLDQGLRILRWILETPKAPTLAAECLVDGFAKAMLFVTPDELILTRTKKLIYHHEVEHRIPLSQLRYVHADPSSQLLNIATAEGFFTVQFDKVVDLKWNFAIQLLKSLMQLPAEEVPVSPEALRGARIEPD